MLIDWPRLIAALVLLLFPIGALHRGKVRCRPISREWNEHWGRIFLLWQHTFDLIRAGVGVWLLTGAIHLAPGAKGLLRYAPITSQAAVVVLGVFLQTIFCREEDSANAPFAYLIGLLAGYLPPVVAGFSILITLVITMGSRFPSAFFPVLALASAGMGFLFTGKKHALILIVAGTACLVPWLFSLLFSRDLVISFRARRHDPVDASASLPPHR